MPEWIKTIIRAQNHPLSQGEIEEIAESFNITEAAIYKFLEAENLI